MSRALWRAGTRWCRSVHSPRGDGGALLVWCGEGCVGAKVDGPGDVEAVAADGARARPFLALVAVVAQDRGGRVVMVAVLRKEEEDLWCREPPAIILATAALR